METALLAGSLAIYVPALGLGPWVWRASPVLGIAGMVLGVLQATGWAATIGIGLTSRFRPFRVMGWSTAVAAATLYLWKHASGLPNYSFFALAGTLGLAMYVGNAIAWWLARRRRDV